MSVLTKPEAVIAEIEDLNSQAWSLNSEDPSQAIELANLALTKSEKINYTKGIALAKRTLGACCIWTSKNEEGVQYCIEANELFKSLKDKQNGAIVYMSLGTNFYFLSDYDTALKCYNTSYELNEKIKYEPGMADALNGVGSVLYSIGENKKALDALLTSEKLSKKNKRDEILFKVHDGLGETYYNLKQYDKSLMYYESCILLGKKSKQSHKAEAFAFDGMGRNYAALKEFDKAIEFYNKSLKIKKEVNFKFGEATTLNHLGNLYIQKKDTKNAIKFLNKAYELAIEIGSKEEIYHSSEKLAELYEKQKNTEEALTYYKIFHQAKEDVKNIKSEQLSKSFVLQNQVLQTRVQKAIIEERGKEQESFSESLTLMGQIGQQIISSLEVETIVKTVYESVNGLMDAIGFGIGIYEKKDNTIVFPLYIEGDERFENIVYNAADNDKLTTLCYNTAQEIIINDMDVEISKYIKKTSKPKVGREVESLIYLPLKYKDTLLGVITVQSFNKNAYSNYHFNILKNLAAYTAIALENAKLYEEQEQKVVELQKAFENTRLVSEIAQEISTTFSIQEIISKVYYSVNKLMDATMFGIGIYDPETEQINFSGVIENGKKLDDYFYPLSGVDRPAVWCFSNQKDYVINSFTKEFIENKKIKDYEVLQGDFTESIMYVPLTQNNKKIGVITVQSYLPNVYKDYHLQLLKNVAIYAAIAIDNASLYTDMEDRVKTRTVEVEKNYNDTRLLSEISKEMSSSLSIETIISSVYKNINRLMKAEAFGIAVYNDVNKALEFKGFRENGELLPDFSVDVNDMNRLAPVCYNTKKDIVINNFFEEYTKYIQLAQAPLIGSVSHSIIYLPLFSKDEIIGVITVQSAEKNAYTSYQVDLLKNLGVSIGIALDNAALYQNIEEKVNEKTLEVVKQKEEIEKTFENTRIVSEIGQEVSSTFSISEIISKVYHSINKLMDATMFGIGIYDEKTEQINFNGAIEQGKLLGDYSYKLTDSSRPAILCYTTQNDIVIKNFTEEFLNSNKVTNRHSLPGQNTESIIYIPLAQNNKKIGVITVQSFKVNAYSDYHLQLLKSLSIYTAIALDNASLYNQMEERVEERTGEIKTAYQNTKLLSEVAEEITSSLSIATIISKVHENVTKFMVADCFGIGLLNKQGDVLEFNGFVESNVVMNDFVFKITDTERLGIQCFLQDKEIFISDWSTEYPKFVKGKLQPVAGKESASVIYLPIYSKAKVIGVITVQSFEKNAYSDYQFNILKNLAVSVGIALDNANIYANLEDKVNERTLEVMRQKEQMEKSFEDTRTLSKLGNDITSTLSIEGIIDKVYSKVTSLMDAVCFGVGLFNKETGKIIYPLFIEGEDKFSSMAYDITEKDKLTYICYNQNKDIVINDFKNEIESFVGKVKPQQMAGGIDTQSVIYLPMVVKEKVMGIITVQSEKSNAYTDYHVQILKNLAVYVAIGIDNAFLYQNMEDMVTERTKEVTKQKELLEKNFNDVKTSAQIAKDIASSLSVEAIVEKVYDNVKSVLSAESFGMGIFNPATNSLQFQGFIEKGEKLQPFEFNLADKERYAVWCWENEKEIIINDNKVEYKKYIKELKASIAGEKPESLVYLPLFTKEKKIGVLTAQSFKKNAFQEFQVNILKNMALSIATALDNANLYQNLEAKVEERTAEVHKQKAIIEEKNKDITDSIRYAKKIQQAIAPNIDEFNKNFVDSFILYKPKDIVSGDFYWFEHFGDTTVFAAADCTGHGVPGAFMSLICSDIMYKVIQEQKIHDPGKALSAIDEKLVKLIKKSSEASANDGMDIAICTYEKRYKILSYAGAHRPLILVRDKQIIEYRPNKYSIGGHTTDGKHFDMNEIKLKSGDMVYLLTDGYADQFGGVDGKKFKFKNFKELVISINDRPMPEQKKILDETFEGWRGTLEQIDDVCVIGIRV